MLFNSIEFFIFLPIVFLLYWFVFNKSIKLQNLFVVLMSYVFYGWWNWRFLILIVFTSFCSWLSGLLIEKYKDLSKYISVGNILLNLLVLGVFKYYDFFVQSFADVFLGGDSNGLLLQVMLPVGISFYTFQALSYSIDVYKGKLLATKDIIQFLAYVSFFPQLVAGPIERATNLLPQFSQERLFDYARAVEGCRLMLWGFFKKIVIADNCALIVNQIFDSYAEQPASVLLLGAILFTFQIYGDFSGYSNIAIGTARLFGINLMQNFKVPYFSRDIAEFWRRWHISLTTWFRDYIYIPLGGSRCSKIKVLRNTLVIFLISGLWHGANWTFIVWGVYHAFLFLPLILMGKNRRYTDTIAGGRILPSIKEALQMIITFSLVVVGWVIFRAETITDAVVYLSHLFDTSLFILPKLPNPDVIYNGYGMVFLLIGFMLVVEWLFRDSSQPLAFKMKFFRISFYYFVFFLIWYFSQGEAQQFIYFQF